MTQEDFRRRFAALERLYGDEGFGRISCAHVAVVGIGGVGSWAVEALARSGISKLTLIDFDHIAPSNINRQVHALSGTIGQSKVIAMTERIEQINPQCQVRVIDQFVEPENWPQLLGGDIPDVVIDACDRLRSKVAMALWALQTKVALITVGAAGGKKSGEGVEVEDLSTVSHDRLLSKMRQQLRRKHGAAPVRKGIKVAPIGISAVFSRESAISSQSCSNQDAQSDGSLNCHGYGSSICVTATFGMVAAGYCLDRIATRKINASKSSKI